MFLPKTEVQSTLKALGYYTAQSSQAALATLPAITFRVDDNAPDYNLDKEIDSQTVVVTVDVWAPDSVTASTMLKEVEAAMRDINYLMTYSTDAPPAPEDTAHHIVSRFRLTVGASQTMEE
jgi:hypothetical protein